jgi:glycosyltransferase involved in cell wall biosynthesis
MEENAGSARPTIPSAAGPEPLLVMRLGVYADLVYRSDGRSITTDRAFVLFVSALAPRLGEITFFGRLDPEPGRSEYELPSEGVRFVPFPHYPKVTSVGLLLRGLRRSRATFARELDALDAVWIFGPHPVSLALAREARRRGKPVILGVRQNLARYISGRLPSRWWSWAVPAAHALELGFRRLARTTPTVVVGEELGRAYGRAGGPLLVTGFSLVSRNEIVPLDEALQRAWDGELRLLSVGRLDPEKNPLLLAEILAELRQREPRWRLSVVGRGALTDGLRARAIAVGVSDALDLEGYVRHGDDLLRRYRSSHAFLHVSLTEGLPQVLYEAQASGLPIVATDVGGVGAALGHGERGILVPPADPARAAAALERLRQDPELRRKLVERGLAHAAGESMEAQLEGVAAFLERHAE